MSKIEHCVILSEGEYCVTKIIEHDGNIGSEIVHRCKTLKEANKFLTEDGVPGNSVSAGNVSPGAGEVPPVPIAADRKKKKRSVLLRRFRQMIMPPVFTSNDDETSGGWGGRN